MRAVNIVGLRGKVPGAVQGNELGMMDRAGPHGFQDALLIKGLEKIIEEIVEMSGTDRIKSFSNMVIRGNFPDLKETMSIGGGACLLHGPLEGEKRRTLSEEDREGGESNVGHGILFIGASA